MQFTQEFLMYFSVFTIKYFLKYNALCLLWSYIGFGVWKGKLPFGRKCLFFLLGDDIAWKTLENFSREKRITIETVHLKPRYHQVWMRTAIPGLKTDFSTIKLHPSILKITIVFSAAGHFQRDQTLSATSGKFTSSIKLHAGSVIDNT